MYFLRFATRNFELLYPFSQDNCTAVCRTDANEMLYTYITLKLSGGNKDGNWLLCKFKSRAKLIKLLGYWISTTKVSRLPTFKATDFPACTGQYYISEIMHLHQWIILGNSFCRFRFSSHHLPRLNIKNLIKDNGLGASTCSTAVILRVPFLNLDDKGTFINQAQ